MNNIHKNHLLRLTSAIFLFVSMLVQVQTAFACDYMEYSVQSTCCCEEHANKSCNKSNDCEQDKIKVTDSCCDVQVSLTTSVNVASVSQRQVPEIFVAEAEAPSPFISPNPFTTITPETTFTPLYSAIDTAWYNGADTYLLTHRFRE